MVTTGTPVYDVFIIGGGVNGCAIARDAAGRGLSVCLAEKSDLASGTSSGSTKLIHGGLRYLEHGEFALVRKSLAEREVLLAGAPHVIRPMRFVLPHRAGMRPAWLVRLGLLLYDHLGGRRMLAASRGLNLREAAAGKALRPGFATGFEYSDCRVDDARLVVLNARDAADRGAAILTRTEACSAHRQGGEWVIETRGGDGPAVFRARLLVNASGPWIDAAVRGEPDLARGIRKVRGSHIVVPRLFDNPEGYLLQNADGRIVFVIPFEQDFTLVGTTEVEHPGDPGLAHISDDEIRYLCESVNACFARGISPADVVCTWSAVRPLLDDGASDAGAVTRDYRLETSGGGAAAPLVNVLGGKITTCRLLAEDVLAEAARFLPRTGPPWTGSAPLPGGDFPAHGFDALVTKLARDYPFLDQRHVHRLARQYGTLAWSVLGDAASHADLGRCFGSDLYESEVRYLVAREWAVCAEDVLWRRTRTGLRVSNEQARALETYLAG